MLVGREGNWAGFRISGGRRRIKCGSSDCLSRGGWHNLTVNYGHLPFHAPTRPHGPAPPWRPSWRDITLVPLINNIMTWTLRVGNGSSLETFIRCSCDGEKTMTVKRGTCQNVGVYWNTAYKIEQVTSLCFLCYDKEHQPSVSLWILKIISTLFEHHELNHFLDDAKSFPGLSYRVNSATHSVIRWWFPVTWNEC